MVYFATEATAKSRKEHLWSKKIVWLWELISRQRSFLFITFVFFQCRVLRTSETCEKLRDVILTTKWAKIGFVEVDLPENSVNYKIVCWVLADYCREKCFFRLQILWTRKISSTTSLQLHLNTFCCPTISASKQENLYTEPESRVVKRHSVDPRDRWQQVRSAMCGARWPERLRILCVLRCHSVRTTENISSILLFCEARRNSWRWFTYTCAPTRF